MSDVVTERHQGPGASSGSESTVTAGSEAAATAAEVTRACGIHAEAWRVLRGTHDALVDRMEATFADQGLPSLSWFDVLAALANSEDRRLRPRELVNRVVMTKSGLTRLLDRIEEAGLIERVACPDDRRGHLVVLTDAGLEMYRRMSPVRNAIFAEAFDGVLTEEEATVMASALNRVLEAAMGGACAVHYDV